jgi:FG-GAP-like repeat
MAIFTATATFQVPLEDGNPVQLASGDLNGDGLPDLVLAWEVGVGTEEQPIQILLNNGSGGFTNGSSLVSGALPTVAHPQQIILADLQGTGRLDIFVADHGYDASPCPGHQQKIMEWNGNGQLFDATSTALPQELSFTHRATVGDIYNNGTLDLFYANLPNATGPRPQLLVNNGTGSFALDQTALPTAVTQQGALGNTGALLTDLNGDGYADLVLGGWDPLHTGMHSSILYLNDGQGSFANSTPITRTRHTPDERHRSRSFRHRLT